MQAGCCAMRVHENLPATKNSLSFLQRTSCYQPAVPPLLTSGARAVRPLVMRMPTHPTPGNAGETSGNTRTSKLPDAFLPPSAAQQRLRPHAGLHHPGSLFGGDPQTPFRFIGFSYADRIACRTRFVNLSLKI